MINAMSVSYKNFFIQHWYWYSESVPEHYDKSWTWDSETQPGRGTHILRTVAPPPAVWCPGSASHPVIQMTTLTTRWIADGMSLIWCWPSPYSVSMHTRPQFVVSLLELSMNLCKISQSLVESIYWHDHKEGWLTAVVPTPPAARFKSARKQDLVEDCVS